MQEGGGVARFAHRGFATLDTKVNRLGDYV